MNSTTIIYLIISVLSLILGIKTNDAEKVIENNKKIEKIIERNENDVQEEKRTKTNATDIRP